MPPEACTLTVHMVSSLDGFIAKKDNSISWFDTSDFYDKGVEGEDPEQFLKTIDCYVMGSKTYAFAEELAREYGWAYGDKPTIVLTTRNLKSDRLNIEFYSGDLSRLVHDRLQPAYRNVWIVGGPTVAKAFLQLNLVQEIRVGILPIILGDGVPFFDHIGEEQKLHLKDTKAYKNGMVELCYEIRQQP